MVKKRCYRCRNKLHISAFSPAKRKRRIEDDADGFFSWCRQCTADYQRAVYKTLKGQLAHRVRSARVRAKRFCVPFDLDLKYLHKLWERQGGRCAISGLPFRLEDGSKGKQPFRPSVDRIHPDEGYVKGNIRLVATVVNFGINKWGYGTFLKMCRAVAKMKRKGART
jgi:hypothetical protein